MGLLGTVLGWVMIALFKLPLHFALPREAAALLASFPPFSNAWKTSWFARGIVFTMVFLAFGFSRSCSGTCCTGST